MSLPLTLLQLFFFALIGQVLYLFSTLLAARALGAKATVATLGMGPKLLVRSLGGTRFELCLVPIVASVALEGMLEGEGPPVGFRAMHPLRRVGVVLGSWVVPALVSALLIGPLRAAHHLGTAFPQFIQGGLHVEVGTALWRAFLALPFGVAMGVGLAKMTAFNLLPLPMISGGLALRHLLSWPFPSLNGHSRGLVALHLIATLLMFALLIRWPYALYLALTG